MSAFAAYGNSTLLFFHLLLLPLFLQIKRDFLTPFFAVLTAILSFLYISHTIPIVIEDKSETMLFSWADNAKIDGGSIKGFATGNTGIIVYAVYKFQSEEEKTYFQQLNLPAVIFKGSGSFETIRPPAHEYAFDMRQYLSVYGASGVFEVHQVEQVAWKDTVATRLAAQRKKLQRHIQRYFPEAIVAEAEALLIGDRTNMAEEDATAYRRLGITHLFAISGLHIGLFTFLLREVLLRLLVRRETVHFLLIVLLPLYAVIAGGAPSVWRAVSVTLLVLVSGFGQSKLRLDDALAVSAIAFILYKPYVLFQPGFQLSYLAALSLILSSKILSRATSTLSLSFTLTMISQLALYPVLLFHFHELSMSSFLVNLVYVPLYSVIILPANLLFLILTFIAKPIANGLFFFYVPFRMFVQQATGWIATLPYQLWTPGKPDAFAMLLAVIGVLCFFVNYEEKKRLYRTLPFIIVPAFLIQLLPYTDSTLRVAYLDVAQGDSIVIELPYRRAVYVIDTGGTVTFGEGNWQSPSRPFEVGRKVVVPYLKGRGISTIDKLIISHPHADHMEGADEVVEEVRVKEVHIASKTTEEDEMADLLHIVSQKKIPLIEVEAGASWREGDTAFMYMGPQSASGTINDRSLVLYMKTTGPSFLFTGDMEEEAERMFVKQYGNVLFEHVILKAAHHGSKTSSTEAFIELIQPISTIVSAGQNNRYGHPSPEVMDLFNRLQIPVWVTADHGTILITVRKEAYAVTVVEK